MGFWLVSFWSSFLWVYNPVFCVLMWWGREWWRGGVLVVWYWWGYWWCVLWWLVVVVRVWLSSPCFVVLVCSIFWVLWCILFGPSLVVILSWVMWWSCLVCFIAANLQNFLCNLCFRSA
jgi:hypothetical protein